MTTTEARAKVVRMLAAGLRWSAISRLCEGAGLRCYIRSGSTTAEIVIESPRTYYVGGTLNPSPPAIVSMA